MLTDFNVSNNNFFGTLSKTPSVATKITSPSSTGNDKLSADSGLSDSTLSRPGGGKDNWKGVLK